MVHSVPWNCEFDHIAAGHTCAAARLTHMLMRVLLLERQLNAFYVVWDCMDDFLFRKANESDAALFARLSTPTVQGERGRGGGSRACIRRLQPSLQLGTG